MILDLRSRRQRSSGTAGASLLVLALALLLGESTWLPHRHDDHELGLYNARCVLASLESVRTDAIASEGSPPVGPCALARSAEPAAAAGRPRPAAGGSDSRAPPVR